ncbi:hypothetical protein CCR75_001492 [Bremia lactucae]|uniref:WRKY19-like zinc finger domain-containing protein n=1 Tax=Bremia lactucae TaxID=4779 RepID=A0A976ILW9_BRELC|nr:hypothetical protein CCR75_001492 [Bremia lactucae]
MSTTSNRCIANRARCQFAKKCDKFVQTRGLCKAHGGNSRCRDPQCNKPAQSRGLCIVHGGGRRCQFNRCKKLAQSKGYCITHGGGRRCIMANCDKFSQVKGRCKFHSKVSTVESSSPPIAITTSTSTFAISPTNAKLSMEFLANPLSRSSFMGDKVLSTYPQIQMPTTPEQEATTLTTTWCQAISNHWYHFLNLTNSLYPTLPEASIHCCAALLF